MDQPQMSFHDVKQLRRVECKLGAAILTFCKNNQRFHLADLQAYVISLGISHSPSSPDRILRLLRAGKQLNYRVIDRSKSLYEVTG